MFANAQLDSPEQRSSHIVEKDFRCSHPSVCLWGFGDTCWPHTHTAWFHL